MPPKLEILNNAIEKGAAILGNPEAKFNQSVKERMKKTGETEDDAQRGCLSDLARTLQAETASGVVEKKSQNFREFQGALSAILSRKEIKRCKKDSETGLFTPPTGIPAVTTLEIENQRSYFREKFKNYGGSYIPDSTTISRHATQTKNMDALLAKVASGLSSGSIDLADLKIGGNADSADIGKILALKEAMDRAESLHEFRLGGAKIMSAMWESAKTDITKTLWNDVKNIFSHAGGKRPDNVFFGLVAGSAKLALDIGLIIPKALAKGALNAFTLRPDRVH